MHKTIQQIDYLYNVLLSTFSAGDHAAQV